jgi:hypothetical protein
MTRLWYLYDSDMALVLVLVVLGFLMWLPTDVYLRQAADDLCLQLGLLGLLNSTHLFHSLRPLARPSVTSLTLWITRSALCSSASVTRRYLVTCRHDIPLPCRLARSQRVTISAQVGLRAVCTLHHNSTRTPCWHPTGRQTSSTPTPPSHRCGGCIMLK